MKPDDLLDPVLLACFAEEVPGQAAALRRLAGGVAAGAADDADRAQARRLAHTIKGAGAILGLKPLVALTHGIEELLEVEAGPAADGRLVDAVASLQQMVEAIAGPPIGPASPASLDAAGAAGRGATFASLLPRLRRLVQATARATGKEVDLHLRGGQTRLGGQRLSDLAGPLSHLLRNAVDHGIEAPAERRRLGKRRRGRIEIAVDRAGDRVDLRLADDGCGLDLHAIGQRARQRGLLLAADGLTEAQAVQFVLRPGFTTRDQVTETSGRGIGLDAVRAWVRALGGSLQIESSPGRGCRVELQFDAGAAAEGGATAQPAQAAQPAPKARR